MPRSRQRDDSTRWSVGGRLLPGGRTAGFESAQRDPVVGRKGSEIRVGDRQRLILRQVEASARRGEHPVAGGRVGEALAVFQDQRRGAVAALHAELRRFGTVELCSIEEEALSGRFSWLILNDTLNLAFLNARDLGPASPAEMQLDTVPVSDHVVGDRGGIYAAFSSDPFGPELPLPALVLPLSAVQRIDVLVSDTSALTGTAGTLCANSPSTRVFADGFESGHTGAWSGAE